MAIALACHEGMSHIITSYFDNLTVDDTCFYYILHTDSITPSVLSDHSTHTDLAVSSYGGTHLFYDSLATGLTDNSGILTEVQQGILPQITFTFTADVGPIKSIGLYGMTNNSGFVKNSSKLYFVEALTPFSPMTGDVFKYTLTIKIGNAAALT